MQHSDAPEELKLLEEEELQEEVFKVGHGREGVPLGFAEEDNGDEDDEIENCKVEPGRFCPSVGKEGRGNGGEEPALGKGAHD